jgi:uncharacterized SAM-binding protein YcdF (DUF218 family)
MKFLKSILTNFLPVFMLMLTPALIIALVQGYKNAAIWLYARNPLPDKIDYLCTFAGNPSRELYALQLYRRYTPVWVASTQDKKDFIKWAYQNGVDTNKIIVIDKCESTLEEIRFFKSQIEKLPSSHAHSIAFVSSPLHMRRILIYNLLVNHNHLFHIYSLPVPLEQSGLSQKFLVDWRSNNSVRDVVSMELFKMAGGIISTTPFLGSWFNVNIEEKVKKRMGE